MGALLFLAIDCDWQLQTVGFDPVFLQFFLVQVSVGYRRGIPLQ